MAVSTFTVLPALQGCVVPIGPDFHDPPPTIIPALLPYVVTSSPQLEGPVGLDSIAPNPFAVQVRDPNLTDNIYYRWVANYPPYTNVQTKQLAGDTATVDANGEATLSLFVYCPGNNAGNKVFIPSAADRTLAIVIADRPFADPTAAGVNPDYQFSYYFDDQHILRQTTVIGTWRITSGCSSTQP